MRNAVWIGLVVCLCLPGLAQTSITEHQPTWSPPTLAQVEAALTGVTFDRFVDISYEKYLLRFPQILTHYGMARSLGVRNDRLDDYSEDYLAETRAIEALILERLQSFDREALSADRKLTYDVCLWYWDDLVRGQEFSDLDYLVTHYYITSRDWGLFDLLTVVHPFSTRQDVEDYMARLQQVERQYDQLAAALERRAERGVVAPAIILAQAITNLQGLNYASARSHPFYTALSTGTQSMASIPAAERTRLLAEAADIMTNQVLPATQRLYNKLVDLRSTAPESIAYGDRPNGSEYYSYALRHQTQTDLSASEIHTLGLEQVARLQTEIKEQASALGYPDGLSISAIYSRVANDGGSFNASSIVTAYEEILERAKENVGEVFDLVPRATVVVVPDAIGGYYRASNGSRPAEFAAPASGSQPYYSMPTLTYHETIPGHHLQIGLAAELDLPVLRSIEVFLGFTEGWALYSERLAWELGWYDEDPYGNMGRLSDEMMRAVRLVVDTGIHTMGWTYSDAVNYFAENTGRPLSFARAQIQRYIVWPGQSTSYMIGFLEILKLREEARETLGEAFDLTQFHSLLIKNGSLPLGVLRDLVAESIP